MSRLIRLLLFSLSTAAIASPGSEPVFQYDPKVVTLSGNLTTRIYPGPPNYESVKSGDKPERVWLIKMPQPISVECTKDPNSFNERETGIEEIQVILTDLKGEDTLKITKVRRSH